MQNQYLAGLPESLESLDDDDPNIKPVELGSLTNYESRLVQALREGADRFDYWTKKGRPDKNHKFLISLYAKFFEILAHAHISYWIDFGSLLGYIRHHGIFPWEYDMDIGIQSEEFPKLEALALKLQEEQSEWGFKWHSYEDWEGAPDYVFFNKNYPDVLCDVTLYTLSPENQLQCYHPEWNYPEYSYADVFPLRKVVIFGQPALIPQDPEKVLRLSEKVLGQITIGSLVNVNRVKWMQYDPIPFLLCQLANPKFTKLLCTYSLQSVVKVDSVEHVDRTKPFVTKSLGLLQQGTSEEFPVVVAKDKLPSSSSSSSKFRQPHPENGVVVQLTEGEQSLLLCPPEHAGLLEKAGLDQPIAELLYFQEHLLWGKMFQVLLLPGDSLYIPQGYWVRQNNFGKSTLVTSLM